MRTTGRCVPARKRATCALKLAKLQRLHATTIATLRLDVLNRHERLLDRCR